MYVNIIIYSNKLLFVWSTLQKVKKKKIKRLSLCTARFTSNLIEFMKIIRLDAAIIRVFKNKLKVRGHEILTFLVN